MIWNDKNNATVFIWTSIPKWWWKHKIMLRTWWIVPCPWLYCSHFDHVTKHLDFRLLVAVLTSSDLFYRHFYRAGPQSETLQDRFYASSEERKKKPSNCGILIHYFSLQRIGYTFFYNISLAWNDKLSVASANFIMSLVRTGMKNEGRFYVLNTISKFINNVIII